MLPAGDRSAPPSMEDESRGATKEGVSRGRRRIRIYDIPNLKYVRAKGDAQENKAVDATKSVVSPLNIKKNGSLTVGLGGGRFQDANDRSAVQSKRHGIAHWGGTMPRTKRPYDTLNKGRSPRKMGGGFSEVRKPGAERGEGERVDGKERYSHKK